MSYKVTIERRAEKDILNLGGSLIDRVVDAISSLSENPRPSGCRKLKVQHGYRIRVGDIRVLYTIDDEVGIITVYRVSRRDQAYIAS